MHADFIAEVESCATVLLRDGLVVDIVCFMCALGYTSLHLASCLVLDVLSLMSHPPYTSPHLLSLTNTPHLHSLTLASIQIARGASPYWAVTLALIGQGLDQTRGWFYTLMVLSTALFDRPVSSLSPPSPPSPDSPRRCSVGLVLAVRGCKRV